MPTLPLLFHDATTAALDSGNVVPVTDHVAQGLERLIPEYQETPRWQAWIESFLVAAQAVEIAAFDIWEAVLGIDLATGVQLELIGRIVREDRDGRTDDDYRRALSVRVLVNRSQGRLEELIKIARTFTNADAEVGAYVRIKDVQPARLEVRVVRTPITTRGELDKRLRKAKGGGVALQTLLHPGGPTGSFRLIDVALGTYPEGDTAQGFSDGALGSVAGGALADVLG